MMEEPGNTPVSKLCNKGMSSAINLGTIVSHKLFMRMFCSHSTVISLASFSLAFSERFKFPALTNTLFRALNPKS